MRLHTKEHLSIVKHVSIHAPREGCDKSTMIFIVDRTMFQFTHPGRGATKVVSARYSLLEVSIHAPREGCDWIVSLVSALTAQFQFTHPGRGAT